MVSLLLALLLSSPSHAAPDIANLNPLHVKEVVIRPEHPEPGKVAEVKLKVEIDPGFHAYVDQYKLKLIGPSNLYLSEIQVEPQVKFEDPISKKVKWGTQNYAEIVGLLEIPASASSGPLQASSSPIQIEMELTYQACGSDFCLFPKKIPVEAMLQLAGGKVDKISEILARGWLSALLVVFFAGILTSLTPCIFPMIPITLAVLGTKHHQSRRKSFLLSLYYVLGIAITYSILGVMAAKTGALFGSLLGSPLVVSFIGLLFVIMGLSMYGLFEIQLPLALANRLSKNKMAPGMVGAFGSGLIAGLVASPCVGPVLISILAYVAQTQNVFAGFILLFTFALGLGQLFLVLGTFHGLIHRLPKSGAWMERVKYMFGTIMIGMAFYFIYPVAHGPLFDGLIASALIILSIYFGAFKNQPQPSSFGRSMRAFMWVIFALGLVFAVKSLAPRHMTDQIFPAAESEIRRVPAPDWHHYSAELLIQAKQNHKPVIVDFKADWCLACKELDLYTFSNPQILELGKNAMWLEFDATSPSDELEQLQKKYNIGGLPFILIFDREGNQRTDLTLTGFEKPEDFIVRLKKVL